MITLIILLWIAAALNAPGWIFIVGGIGVLLKLFNSFFRMCIEAYKLREL